MIWKFFFFAISLQRYVFMRALTYAVLKMVFSLMADWNVVSNSEFFILIHTSSHIFCAKNISECAIFYSLSTSWFKAEASFNEKISFMRSGEKVFKSLNDSIVRRCKIFKWIIRIIILFRIVLCKLIYEVYLILLFIYLQRSR